VTSTVPFPPTPPDVDLHDRIDVAVDPDRDHRRGDWRRAGKMIDRTGQPPTSEILDRPPPCNREAENGVLGSCLIDGSKLSVVEPILRPDHFYSTANSKIYSHMLAMRNGEGGAVDAVLLAARLQEHGDLEAVGGRAYLAELMGAVAVAAHAEYYAKIVRDQALKRETTETCKDLLQDAYSGQGSGTALAARARSRFETAADNAAKTVFPVRTCSELMAADLEPAFLVDRLLVELQPLVIGGPMKSLKTSVLVALVFALATATKFLGKFNVTRAVNVALLSAESGLAAIRDLLIRIGATTNIKPADVSKLYIGEDIPTINDPEHEAGIRQLILDRELEVIAFDPFYLGNDEDSQSNLAKQGKQLRRLTKICLEMGVTPIICHHTKKASFRQYEPLGLADLHGAGTGEFARQFWLLNRRAEYQDDGCHELWFRVGASYGHGGLWALDVEEGVWDGPGSRHWKIAVMDGTDARGADRARKEDAREEAKEAARREKVDAAKKLICETMAKAAFRNGETLSVIRDATGLHTRQFRPAFAELIEAGDVVPCDIFKPNRKKPYDGYKLNDTPP